MAAMDMIRPEHLLKLPMLNEETKKTYGDGLTKLWNVLETQPKDSEQHQQAMTKIKAVSKDIMMRISTWKSGGGNAQRPQSQAGGANQQRPPVQQNMQQGQQPAQAQNQPMQGQQQQQAQQQGQQFQMQMGQNQNQGQQQQQQQAQAQQQQQGQQGQQAMPQMSQQAKNFVAAFQVFPPANIQPNSPEWEPYKTRVLRAVQSFVITQEQNMQRYSGLDSRIKQLEANSQPVPTDVMQAREQAKHHAQQAKQRIDSMRAENNKHRAYWQAQKDQAANPNQQQQQQQPQQQQQQQQQQPQQQIPNAASPVQNSAPGQQMMNQQVPQMQQQQQQPPQIAQQQQQQQQQQQVPQQQQQQQQQQPRQTQMPNGAPMYAPSPSADNAQNAARNAMSPAVAGPFQNQNQQTPVNQTPHQGQPFVNQGQGQGQGQAMGARPQPMPQQQNFQSPASQQPGQPGSQAIPQPLSQQAAISQANRSYSQQNTMQQQQGTPNQADNTPYPQISSAQNSMNVNQKFPIPKTLNVQPQTPVPMAPARPTFGGPSNGAPGMMGQPAMTKQPGFILEGEGDRVLSKKKLDELVRQVTGGGEGDGLTPEVEEAVLTLADDFVDSVITSACRLAKIRPNSTLDIRDIQIVLERNYNIRVPGYSLDEIRTVRKFQPAPGWTQKMNAVQAAKVMGKNES